MTKLWIVINPSNTASLAMHRVCGNQCDHSDKKRVHRWLPINLLTKNEIM